jgi:pyruvate/2-oxoglutarate dehydrogenase complex dihydrolipoamide dehydrogenase (E3) component
MPGTERYDVLIIGAGQAGAPLAHALAGRNRKVALAERRHLGGSCVNFGCTPTKAAVASARLVQDARRASEFGITIAGLDVDFPAVIKRARAIALESRRGLETWFEGAGGNPAWLRGHARLTGRRDGAFLVSVGDREVAATSVVLDTGTRTRVPPIEGLGQVPFFHAGNWLDLLERPKHLLVLGTGVIALEMAQFYRRMGSEVTLIERSERIAKSEDADVASALQRVFESEGIAFRFGSATEAVAATKTGVRLTVRRGDVREFVDGSHLFVATGRLPNTDDLGLETVGVEVSSSGIVRADERLSTNVPGIWVAGDIRGGPQFTHSSWDDHRILLDQMTQGGGRTTDRIVPYAIFTDPEIGRVGMSEAEAAASGKAHTAHRFDMSRSGRARERGNSAGFLKVIVEEKTGLVLGATAFADQGAELVHVYVTLMTAGAPARVIRDSVHIHPTLAEAVQSVVAGVAG